MRAVTFHEFAAADVLLETLSDLRDLGVSISYSPTPRQDTFPGSYPRSVEDVESFPRLTVQRSNVKVFYTFLSPELASLIRETFSRHGFRNIEVPPTLKDRLVFEYPYFTSNAFPLLKKFAQKTFTLSSPR